MTNQYPNLTVEAVIDEVRNLANQRPDFVYQKPSNSEMCRYRHDNEPGCIMGHVLANLAPNFVPVEGTGITAILEGYFSLPLSYQQRSWLAKVQTEQDHGFTWSNAVRTADAVYPLPVAA